nr:unnamed protein product [Digitaria exilis]
MAELLATMVVLLSMVKEKASSYLLDQYKEPHKLLKRKLSYYPGRHHRRRGTGGSQERRGESLAAVRMVAYKANDVLDEFKYEAMRLKAKEEGHYKDLGMDVIKLFPTQERL